MIEIKIPSPGESITEVEVGRWLVADGDLVEKGQDLAEIESDKATLTLNATAGGAIHLLVKEGDRVAVGSIACRIDDSVISSKSTTSKIQEKESTVPKEPDISIQETPVTTVSAITNKLGSKEEKESSGKSSEELGIRLTPTAKAMMEENDLSIDELLSGLRRIGKHDIEAVLALRNQSSKPIEKPLSREVTRTEISPLRRKLSERLVAVKNETAMLTTFNEVDMSAILHLREQYQQQFVEKHGLKLGFMGIFTKAVSLALTKYPQIGSMIDHDQIVTPQYHDIGIAVQTPKGLMVPIIRNAEAKSVATIEKDIKQLADRARDKKLTIEEMTGGTFTITNGGVYGSLMSTPIINPPQSAILGMHAVKDRVIAVNGKIEIRPMMYIALSYDHRIIDGKDSVSFLVLVKELAEHPERLLTGGVPADKELLDL